MAPALATIFRLHRFVAGGFGLGLLLAPTEINAAFRLDGSSLPLGERMALQSWGCFIIAVAYIVHEAINFPLAAQKSIARALVLCFSLINILYTYMILFADLETQYAAGVAATGVVFFVLLVAYCWSLSSSSKIE